MLIPSVSLTTLHIRALSWKFDTPFKRSIENLWEGMESWLETEQALGWLYLQVSGLAYEAGFSPVKE